MNKHLQQIKTYCIVHLPALLFSLLFSLAAVVVSLHRFWQYEVFYYDFGIFDSALWKVSQFQAPIIDHLVTGGKVIFADHFSPSLFLLSPLFWFTERSEILLIVQALCVGISGLVIYTIGNTILKNRLQSFSILACYYFFLGLQNAIIFDFHEITVMTLPLSIVFWAIVKKKLWVYILFFVLTLGFKESTFLLGVAIGIVVYLLNKEWKIVALMSICFSLLWGLVTIRYLIPYFSGGIYLYEPVFTNGVRVALFSFFSHPLKRETLFYSFLSFGFLPLLSPVLWMAIVQDFAMRFLPDAYTRWGLGFHYSAQTAVLLAVGSVLGMKNFIKVPFVKKYVTFFPFLLIANAFFLYRFLLHGPLALAYNPAFYRHTQDFHFLDQLVEKIPHDASVMAQNNIVVRFTHQKMWLLRSDYERYKPSYIVIDIRKGQNPNNFYGTVDVDQIVARLQIDPAYVLVHNTGEQFIFKRR